MRDFAKLTGEPWLRHRVGELGLALGLGLAFALIGPFSTDRSDFLPSLGYWAGLVACWFVVAALVDRGLREFAGYREAGVWAKRACLVMVASIPMLPVVAPATSALNGFEATIPEVAEMYWQIVLIASVVVVLADAILGAPNAAAPLRLQTLPTTGLIEASPAPAEAASAAPASSRLIERLPPNLRGALICLEMEDHYVRVHTSRGSALLLMRLGDAMNEAAPTAGLQSHRSWWVAEQAVEAFERSGRTGRIRLANGMTAPVSQRYLRSIEELPVAGSRQRGIRSKSAPAFSDGSLPRSETIAS